MASNVTDPSTQSSVSKDLVEATLAILPRLRALAEDIDRDRSLPEPLVGEMAGAGLFKMAVPRRLGGLEVDPPTVTSIIETVSGANGSAGWVLMIINATPLWAAAMMSDEVAREVFCRGEDVLMAGTLVPHGKAEKVDGGYRITGRWPFGSGCLQANWMANACWLYEGDRPVEDENGRRAWALFLTPRADCEIIDTWHVTGLRGTGSHDYAIGDAFVPEGRMFRHPSHGPSPRTEAYYAYLAVSVAFMSAVSLGIARGAVDELRTILGAKLGRADGRPLAEDPEKQTELARADTLVSSASTYLHHLLDDIWTSVQDGRRPSRETRGRFRAACTHAVHASVQAVDLCYASAGTTSIYVSSPLERHFRDIHAAAAHAFMRPALLSDAGRLLLDMEPQSKLF